SNLREDGFQSLSEQEKEQLANLSYKIRMSSRSEWIEWMNRPLSAQLMLMEEVQNDYDSR
ncbi:hypothetical protein R0K20_16050, partial [Staphylococcus sp. SIMBA_130]